jgi:4-hydroxy-tetrahydrodipicolinate synthase
MQYNSVITVIPTFFTDDNTIDFNSIINHINHQLVKSIKKIVILGTTSETPTLKITEKIDIAETVWDNFHTKLDIVIGLSGNDTEEVVIEAKLLQHYCHSMMLSAPYYNKPSQAGIYDHFKDVITSIDKEFIIYNIPSRCGVNIEPETISKLFHDFITVKAIKEASGSIDQVMKIRMLCDINILSGDDALILPFMSVGAVGVISVLSNVMPKTILDIVNNFTNGNIKEARNQFYKNYDFIKMAFCESNPVPIKAMLSHDLIYNQKSLANVRKPLLKITDSNYKIISDMINSKVYDGF